MNKIVYVDCLFCGSDGLVVGLSCFGKSLDEDLPCGPKLGVLVEVVVLDVMEMAAFKTVEALRGALFFSTGWVLENVKGAGGGGAGREIMDSNTSLPSVLTHRHFDAVSSICLDRSDLAWTSFSGRLLLQSCG